MNPGRPQGAEPAAKANYQERKAFKQKVRTYGIQQRKNQTDQTFDGFGGAVAEVAFEELFGNGEGICAGLVVLGNGEIV